jgi:hypothetical protein
MDKIQIIVQNNPSLHDKIIDFWLFNESVNTSGR